MGSQQHTQYDCLTPSLRVLVTLHLGQPPLLPPPPPVVGLGCVTAQTTMGIKMPRPTVPATTAMMISVLVRESSSHLPSFLSSRLYQCCPSLAHIIWADAGGHSALAVALLAAVQPHADASKARAMIHLTCLISQP